jgi:hypothetical protein
MRAPTWRSSQADIDGLSATDQHLAGIDIRWKRTIVATAAEPDTARRSDLPRMRQSKFTILIK